MFSPLGCFKKIACPLDGQCELLNCIFLHKEPSHEAIAAEDVQKASSTQAPNKRLRLSPPHDPSSSSKHQHNVPHVPKEPQPKMSDRQTNISAFTSKLKSGRISPPPLKRPARPPSSTSNGGTVPATTQIVKESLNPRMMSNAPAAHSSRSLYLKKLYEIFVRLNDLVDGGPDSKSRKFSEAQLITMALDEEEKIAKENGSVYPNIIKLRMVALSKMTPEQWAKEQQQNELKAKDLLTQPENPEEALERLFYTGLSTAQEVQLLPRLYANNVSLRKHGFVTSPPTDEDIRDSVEGTDASMGWEQCDRCKSRFQVFPDRREDGSLTSGGQCTYHPGRIGFPEIKGSADNKVYSCCNQAIGVSIGCDVADTHVFKINDEKRLASILQYEETPPNPNAQQAVCFDCEMGYTVNGMELIRLTVVSWPEGDELLDILVKPLGAILDLNSRYSGVRPEDFINAVPHGTPQSNMPDKQRLQIVDSPMAARTLFFKLISPSTSLIGHALENDLNAARIVHPSIVDTVILFPHKRGLPSRPALRILTKDILYRDIQGAGTGHDSKEDAKSAGDLVRVKLARTWRLMDAKGWKFKGDELVAPLTGASSGLAAESSPKVPAKRSPSAIDD